MLPYAIRTAIAMKFCGMVIYLTAVNGCLEMVFGLTAAAFVSRTGSKAQKNQCRQ